MSIKQVTGDLIQMALDGEFDVIVHGCNCFTTMGAGIALQIKNTFPLAYRADCATTKGDHLKLGTISKATVGSVTIINAYTQYGFNPKSNPLNYEALEQALTTVKKQYPNSRIGMPKIGAGLGGGNWNRINKIITKVLGDADATVVTYG